MDISHLKAINKTEILATANALSPSDINFLVDTLKEKDDKLRYIAFLLLKAHSRNSPYVYAYWDALTEKLSSANSYQRSISVMLLAENVRYDTQEKFAGVLEKFLALCNDEKFITARPDHPKFRNC